MFSLESVTSEILARADQCGCSLVALQETNVSVAQAPGMIDFFHRQGWQYLGLPSPGSGGRGGVCILARQPLAVAKVTEFASSHGRQQAWVGLPSSLTALKS